MSRNISNVSDISLHIAAWGKAEREHSEKGELEKAAFAREMVAILKQMRTPRHLR